MIMIVIVLIVIVIIPLTVIRKKSLIISTLPHFTLINKHLKGHNLPGDKQQIRHNGSLFELILDQQFIGPFG